MNIFVSGFSLNFTDLDLSKLFEPYGEVTSVCIILGRDGASRGYGFVSMACKFQAVTAIEKLDASIPKGCQYPITVKQRTII